MSSHLPVPSVLRVVALLAVTSLLSAACGSPVSLSPSAAEPSRRPSNPPSASADAALPPRCPAVPNVASSPSSTSWWRDRTFYEVFVRSFADSNGAGIGDLRGLIGKLDYLNEGNPATYTDLGVTATG